MNRKGIGFGIFLLSLGVIWLLVNFDILNFNVFNALFTLWPLILVVIGINLIFRDNGLIRGLTWLIFLIIIVVYGTYGPSKYSNFHDNWSFGSNEGSATTSRHIEELMRTGLNEGTLKLDAGAVQLGIQDESDKLLIADSESGDVNCDINYTKSGENAEIKLNNKNRKIFGPSVNNKLDIKLNNKVVWDIKLDTGASNGDIDLSNLKVKNLSIDSGAVNYKIKLGANVPVTDVNVDSGASNFEFDIPSNDVGVRVKLDGALNNTNLSELGWAKNGSAYESPNYKDAKAKINMDADIGVAKLKINYQ